MENKVLGGKRKEKRKTDQATRETEPASRPGSGSRVGYKRTIFAPDNILSLAYPISVPVSGSSTTMASLSATDLILILAIAAAGAYWLFVKPAGTKVDASVLANGQAKSGSGDAADSRDFAAAMQKAVSLF
jgi:hypothetical protein